MSTVQALASPLAVVVGADKLRVWCEFLAREAEGKGLVQRIVQEGRPYLDRFYLGGWHPGRKGKMPALYLHHFRSSDTGQVHSHPWGWSASLMLVGGYREFRCGEDGSLSDREFRPGDVNVIGGLDKHRVELLGVDCWTLFLAGLYARPWGFHDEC